MTDNKRTIIEKAKKINDVLVEAVFHDDDGVLPAFHKINQHHKTSRQALISFNCMITEIVYHEAQGSRDITTEMEEMIVTLFEELCAEKS